jgi:peptidoglycan/LPS O-acetylase OafA/YrhL
LITGILVFVLHRVAFREIAGNLAASCVYLHNLIFGTSSAVNAVAWSLEVEVQFYILAPLLSLVFLLPARTRRSILLGSIGFVCLVNAFLVPAESKVYILTLPYHLHYFLTGFLLADLFIVHWNEAPTRIRRWDWIGGAAWLAMAPVRLNPLLYQLLFPFLVFLAYVGAFRGPFLNAVFRRPWLVTIGGMCYTIYLYHAVVITALVSPLQGRLPEMGYLLSFLVAGILVLPATLFVSSLMFVTCEKPFMRRDWPRKWYGRARTLLGLGAPAPAPAPPLRRDLAPQANPRPRTTAAQRAPDNPGITASRVPSGAGRRPSRSRGSPYRCCRDRRILRSTRCAGTTR